MRANAVAYSGDVKRAIVSACGSSVMVDDSQRDHAIAAGWCTAGSGCDSSRPYASMRCARSPSGTGARKSSQRSGNTAEAPPS